MVWVFYIKILGYKSESNITEKLSYTQNTVIMKHTFLSYQVMTIVMNILLWGNFNS